MNTSLLESGIAMLTFQGQRYLTSHEVPEAQGNDHPIISPYGAFSAADGHLNVAVGSEAQWSSLCRVLGAPELATNDEYAAPQRRVVNRAALTRDLNGLFGRRPALEWITELRAAGVPAGPIYRMDQVFADPQVQALGMVVPVGDETDRDHLVRGPLWMDGRPSAVRRRPPALGEHSRQILTGLGYDGASIDALVAADVVGEPK
jgi:crotonobetainyl-CoA:carnitine CoA-transferase CaiB-like acyl-CoA transferase